MATTSKKQKIIFHVRCPLKEGLTNAISAYHHSRQSVPITTQVAIFYYKILCQSLAISAKILLVISDRTEEFRELGVVSRTPVCLCVSFSFINL